MARLLISWLNEEVKLSQLVTSLDDDFRDGYLIGELLARYNQQDDFQSFDRKDAPETRIRNFCLLEPTLRRLEIPFNFKLAFDIMEGKHGVMKALLSEMRAVLDRIKKNSEPPIASKGQNGKIMRVMNPGKAFYDASMSASFEKSMRVMMENPTEAIIKKAVTNRFIALGAEIREQANFAFSEEQGTMQLEKQRAKEIFRHRKKHEGEFAKAWDLLNVEQWKKNQTRAMNRTALTARLAQDHVTRQEQRRFAAMTNAREATFSSIDDFDRRIEREVFREDPEVAATLGASLRKTIAGAPGSGVPELSYVDKLNLEQGLTVALKKIKEQHDEALTKQQSHDRRRRKFVREREFAQSNDLQNLAENEIVSQLLNQSESELVEMRARERVLAQKQVMALNRTNRNSTAQAIDDFRQQRLTAWSIEEARRENDFVVFPRIESQTQRADTLGQSRRAASRQRSIEVATEVLHKILDLTDWVLSCRHLGLHHVSSAPEELVPAPVWDDALKMFSSTRDVASMLPLPKAINVGVELPFSLSEQPLCIHQDFLLREPFQAHHVMTLASAAEEDTRIISEDLSASESLEFFTKVGGVEIDLPTDAATASTSEAESAADILLTPQWLISTPPRFLLGEIIASIRCVSEPLKPDGTSSLVLPALSFRGAIIGVNDSAREIMSKALLEKIPNLTVLRVQDLVHEFSTTAFREDVAEEQHEPLTENEKLAALLSSFLSTGQSVPDTVYVELLTQAICRLPEGSSYVIQDFPSCKKQLSLLLQALSGINFEEAKPCPADRASLLAPLVPVARPHFDPGKCGLDKVILVENGEAATLITERVGMRSDRLAENDVNFADKGNSVSYLQDLYTPLRPVHTFAIDLSVAITEMQELESFAETLGLLTKVSDQGFTSLSGAALALAESLAAGKSQIEIRTAADLEENVDTTLQPSGEVVAATAEETLAVNGTAAAEQGGAVPSILPTFVELPKQLADALAVVWLNSETRLMTSSRDYFCSLRDMRYQMLQRRRGLHDVIYRLLIRRDERQDVFEAFRSQFNAIHQDFRFDSDCIAELHLRTIEMGSAITSICDRRRKEAEAQLSDFVNDGLVQVAIHRSQCEGAALLQALLNSFLASLHLLFDVGKALAKFQQGGKVCNALEEALPATLGEAAKSVGNKDAKGAGKDAGKAVKGKEGSSIALPFREPVAGILLPSEVMSTLPGVRVVESAEPVDAKAAKGKAPEKGKKGDEGSASSDSFELMEKSLLETIEAWSHGSFTVSRAVYSDNEAVCVSIESAIWHEVDRLKFSLETIKKSVEDQIVWLNSLDAEIQVLMSKFIVTRHSREMVCTTRLLEMVGDKIEQAVPIREQWILASDAISVVQGELVLSLDAQEPVPTPTTFYLDRLNEEQIQVLSQCLTEISTGEVILDEDAVALLHLIVENGAGPLGNTRISHEATFLSHIVLPKKMRTPERRQQLLLALAPKKPVAGIAEHEGFVGVESVRQILARNSS